MSVQFENELASFHEFIGQRLGARDISPEEALDLWCAQQSANVELHEAVQALTEALTDMQAGDRGQPFDEFVRELRQRRQASKRR